MKLASGREDFNSSKGLSVAHTLGPPGEDGAQNEQKFFFFIQFDSKVPKKKVSHQLMQKKIFSNFLPVGKICNLSIYLRADLWCCNSISETLGGKWTRFSGFCWSLELWLWVLRLLLHLGQVLIGIFREIIAGKFEFSRQKWSVMSLGVWKSQKKSYSTTFWVDKS